MAEFHAPWFHWIKDKDSSQVETLQFTQQSLSRLVQSLFRLAGTRPRRPRGSQSGREKGHDESFQVRAKEPLRTDSHRIISKNSRGYRLLIGHKKCFLYALLTYGNIPVQPRF